MIIYILVTVVTVCMAYFVNSACVEQQNRIFAKNRQELLNTLLLVGIFTILFGLSALRIGIGNDYWVYRDNFLHIMDENIPVPYEIGFKILVKILQGQFGYDNYRVVFTVMAFGTCAFFVKGLFDNSDWFVFSLYLFLANGFYLMSFSNVRYYFAVAVCIYAIKYLFKKDYVKFLFWILFVAFFHKSVLLVIPVYLAAYYLKWSKKNVWLVPASCAVLFFGRVAVRRFVFLFYPYYEGDLILDVNSISYVNIAKCLAILIFSLFYYRKGIKGDPVAETLFNLNLFALIIYSFGYYIPETSRVCYYMIIGHVFLVPIVLRSVDDKKQRYFFGASVLAAYTLYYLVFLMKSSSPDVLLRPYMTWLFT